MEIRVLCVHGLKSPRSSSIVRFFFEKGRGHRRLRVTLNSSSVNSEEAYNNTR